jgi:acetate kinase
VRVLVVNAGSSSLKLAVVAPDGSVEESTTVERWEGEGHLEPIKAFLDGASGEGGGSMVDAVGHRVVHGGPRHSAPTRVDGGLVDYLDSVTDLAPLHNPRSVAGIKEVGRLLPDVPAVACFDTAFHATMSAAASTYALPAAWNERWQLRRYGFHGLSHGSAVARAAEIVGRPVEELRFVSCHLGAGASLTAVRGGRSVDTTMGFTPLAGLVMQTRTGSVDPGLVLWLLEHGGVPLEELADSFEHESGMKGLSGTSGDLREVLEGRRDGDEGCTLAYDVFLHRLVREIAAMAGSAGGLDVLVMTGGIGEKSPEVRADAAAGLRFLGVGIDEATNAEATGDADISTKDAAVRTVVVTAREEAEIARQTRSLLVG